MSSFTDPLDVRQIPNGNWITLRAMSFYAEGKEGEEVYQVEAGFETDFASIPRVLWPLVGHPAGRYSQAAVFHDKFYRSGQISRKHSDDLFLEGMKVLVIPYYIRWTLWTGVRTWGWIAWNRHRRNDGTGKEMIL